MILILHFNTICLQMFKIRKNTFTNKRSIFYKYRTYIQMFRNKSPVIYLYCYIAIGFGIYIDIQLQCTNKCIMCPLQFTGLWLIVNWKVTEWHSCDIQSPFQTFRITFSWLNGRRAFILWSLQVIQSNHRSIILKTFEHLVLSFSLILMESSKELPHDRT